MLQLTVLLLFAQYFLNEVAATSSVEFTAYGITDKLKPGLEKYAPALSTAAEAFKEMEALFDDEVFQAKRGWTRDTETDDGDAVYTKNTKNGKMTTISTILEGKVDDVMNDIWMRVDTVPSWDPNIDFSNVVVALTNYSDIVTYGNSDVLIVSGRDLVTVRIYRPLPKGGYRMAYRSVTIDEKPETKERVRAHLYLGAIQLRPHPDRPEFQTLYDVATLFDLKGLLPTVLINQFAGRIMVMDTETKVKHFKEIANTNEL